MKVLHYYRLHPWSYIDRQRADQFYRRLQTLLPGCECPAWGRQNRRVPDIDFDSLFNVASSYNQVAQEATPTPHYNTPNYFVVQHFFNNRNNFGVNGSRLFFNEQPRGDFSTTGYYSKRDLEMIDSWFASDKNVIIHKIMNMSEEDRKCSISSLEKWKKNIEIYFPETKQMKVEPVTHKFADEPYHSRNIDELRDKVFIQKYMDSRKSFNQREIRQIKEVFLEGVDNHFFEKSELDEQYHGTKLFNKFTNLFDLPDYFSCTTKSGKLPEVQFMNKIEVRWNINFHTVAVAKETFYSLVKEFETKNQFYKFLSHSYLAESDKLRIHREIRILISEEIYNPLFSSKLESTATNGIGLVSQSINNLDDINNLIELVNQTKEEIKFLNRKAFVNFLVRNRRILQSIPFIPIS